MVCQLERLIYEFKGQESQTRCFTHILNLIAKSIIRQFDTPKAQYGGRILDEATMALMELAGDIECEEQVMAERGDHREDDEEDENTEDWVDERDTMSEEQLGALDGTARPVRLMLVKVCVYFGNSTTMSLITTTCLSYAKLRSPSRTHPLLSSPDGMRS